MGSRHADVSHKQPGPGDVSLVHVHGHGGNVSHDVSHHDVACFVWSRVPHKRGTANKVGIDAQRRVKFTVPNSLGYPSIDLQGLLARGRATVVHPDCMGLQMENIFARMSPLAFGRCQNAGGSQSAAARLLTMHANSAGCRARSMMRQRLALYAW